MSDATHRFTPDLSTSTGGIKSPNPFWLASAPPANSGAQIQRAFEAGWGGAVWKTLGAPIQNVSSRFGGHTIRGVHGAGFTNIELITDRPLEVNLREIAETKRLFPKNPIIVSLMVETEAEWREIIKKSIDAGADGLELNFGCPHGMCERGMGSAVGQEPKINERITSWAVKYSTVPVLVKLTPNVSDIVPHGLAAKRGGAHGVSLINTIKSIISVDIDRFVPEPRVGNLSSNGGYCGSAVKPIALHMVAALAREKDFGLPISGIGGVSNWRDAVEFILLGSSTVQVCTEVMLRGYGVVEDMIDGLEEYMRTHGFRTIPEMVGKAVPPFQEWATSTSTTRPSRGSTPTSASAASCAWPRATTARTSASIRRNIRASRASTRASASAATSARSCAPSPAASRWRRSTTASRPRPGTSS